MKYFKQTFYNKSEMKNSKQKYFNDGLKKYY